MTPPWDGRITEADYLFLRDFLRAEMGYEMGPGKEYLVESRLAPVAATFDLADVSGLLRRLRLSADRTTRDAVIDAMSINETYFFRADGVFTSLRQRMLPALRATRGMFRSIRIWCAGCATGQEPYSVAMTLAEHFPDLASWNVRILATDISDQALERGRQGVYNQFEIQRGLPVQLLLKHFHKVGDHWHISDALRRAVEFRKLNLLEPYASLGGPFDIILLRNVLIYFDRSLVPTLLQRIRHVIADDGYLVLGESETIFGVTDEFHIPKEGGDFFAPVRRPAGSRGI